MARKRYKAEEIIGMLREAEVALAQGETFRSLSQVAQRITGAKWSGPRFFGIASR
jgi:hypothetical protein